MIEYNISLLNKILNVLSRLDNEHWNTPINVINNETIGRHVRHVYDFYNCFIKGVTTELINYDARDRNLDFENNIDYARSKIEEIKNSLLGIDYHKDIILEINIIMNYKIETTSIKSTINRELMNLIDHTIHHGHIIQIAIKNQFPTLSVNDEFISPSTIQHLKCAQ